MKKKLIIVVFIIILLFANISFAQTAEEQPLQPLETETAPRPDLPDISFVGDITGKLSNNKEDEERNKILVRGVELALQGYIYPKMRVDVFLAMHRHGEEMVTEICEGYVNFLDLGNDFSLKVGKMKINFGKVNKIHFHHRPYADQPQVITNFFGSHGLVGEGAVLSYLVPAKRFVQLDLGTWYVQPQHPHDVEYELEVVRDQAGNVTDVKLHEHHEHIEFSLVDKVHTAKLRTSYSLSDISELELGLNFAKGRGPHFKEHEDNNEHKDNVEVYGIDLTYKSWPYAHKRFLFQNELFWLRREVTGSKKIKRVGFYSFVNYKIDKYNEFGVRYDNTEDAHLHQSSGNAAEKSEEKSEAISFIATRNLTETTKLRLQYKYDIKNKKNIAYLQLQFGIGPHSHPLE